jgi:hypothetical protein
MAPPLLTLALDGGEWSTLCPSPFTPDERSPLGRWIGGSVGPRAGQDAVEEKILALPGIPARLPSRWPVSIPAELPRLASNSAATEESLGPPFSRRSPSHIVCQESINLLLSLFGTLRCPFAFTFLDPYSWRNVAYACDWHVSDF